MRSKARALGLTLVAGDLGVDGEHELHVEVPAGIQLGEPGVPASEIHAVEGGPEPGEPG